MIRNLNDGTQSTPALRIYINDGNLVDLPDWSTGPKRDAPDYYEQIRAAGFEGIQGGDHEKAKAAGLHIAAGGRIDQPADAERVAKIALDMGADCSTVHIGSGLEDDATIDAMLGAMLDASAKYDLPIYLETHRGTITQDIWRTVKMVERFPGLRFNGDFSHWYTGLEMVYQGIEKKLDYATPVLERVRFMHGRIGSPGAMQVDIGDGTGRPPLAYGGPDFLEHFRDIWTRCFVGFLKSAEPGDYIVFAPELLFPKIYYALMHPGPDGALTEAGDRWQQALVYARIAKECFAAAQAKL